MGRLVTLALAVCALAAPLLAQDAKLEAVRGSVSVLYSGASRFVPAKGGEELLYGDAVRVRPGGVAHVVFGDRGAVLLRDESLLRLQGSPRQTSLRVPFGEFFIGLRRRLRKGESFRVRTPAAVAAVRGTLFWGKSDKADKSTSYAGFGRTVAVSAQRKTVLLEPGKSVKVAFGQPPSEPETSAIGLDYAKNFAIGESLQELPALAEDHQPPASPNGDKKKAPENGTIKKPEEKKPDEKLPGFDQ